jgi:transcription antitermination factor NusG
MDLETPYDPKERWFALRVKSRQEKVVATMAKYKGFEGFLPLYQTRRHWSDRFQSVDVPLFPGYVFCRLNPQCRLPLLTIPGVLNLVGLGKIPMPIEDTEIATIQRAVTSGLTTEPWPFLEVGQRVRLEVGPLAGLEGLFIRTSNQDRIIVSVSLLKRSVAVAVERHWARPLEIGGRRLVMVKPCPIESSPCL